MLVLLKQVPIHTQVVHINMFISVYRYMKCRYTREHPPHTDFSFQSISSWLCLTEAFSLDCSLLLMAPLAVLLWPGGYRCFKSPEGELGSLPLLAMQCSSSEVLHYWEAPFTFPDSHSLSRISLRAGSHPY